MLDCKGFSKNVSSDVNATWFKKGSMLFHYIICDKCRAYVNQLKKIKTNVKAFYLNQKIDVIDQEIKSLEENIINKIIKKEEKR